jgi:hypothetical protein
MKPNPNQKQQDNPLRQKYLDTVKDWFSQGYRDQIIVAVNHDNGMLKFTVPSGMGYNEAAQALQSCIDDLLDEDAEDLDGGPSGNA